MSDLMLGFISGRLTRDPQVDVTNAGNALTKFTVACNRPGWENGEKAETVTFYSIKTFNKTAEQCGQMLHKGSRVIVNGRLELGAWNDNEGKAKYSATIIASEVQFLDPKPQAEGSNGSALATQAAPAPAATQQAAPAPADVPEPAAGAIQQQLVGQEPLDPDDIPF